MHGKRHKCAPEVSILTGPDQSEEQWWDNAIHTLMLLLSCGQRAPAMGKGGALCWSSLGSYRETNDVRDTLGRRCVGKEVTDFLGPALEDSWAALDHASSY